jgi:hypothetical protein
MLQAQQLVALATSVAKVKGYTVQAGQLLNSILSDLAQTYDFDVAKGSLNFNFTPATAQIGNLNAQLASGPFLLPPDYLRAKKGDVMWFLQNVPYPMIPVDLEEFDVMVQQAGLQSYPYLWATDMSQQQVLATTGSTLSGSTTLSSLLSLAGVRVGTMAQAPGIPGLTTVAAILSGSSVQLSQAATATAAGAAVAFLNPPLAYVWPPASGAYPVLVRYYRQMPDIVTPQSSTAVPWFPNAEYLRLKLSAALMEITDDSRKSEYEGLANRALDKYLIMKDDTSNRAKRVTLDPRRFGLGGQLGTLKNTKTIGW